MRTSPEVGTTITVPHLRNSEIRRRTARQKFPLALPIIAAILLPTIDIGIGWRIPLYVSAIVSAIMLISSGPPGLFLCLSNSELALTWRERSALIKREEEKWAVPIEKLDMVGIAKGARIFLWLTIEDWSTGLDAEATYAYLYTVLEWPENTGRDVVWDRDGRKPWEAYHVSLAMRQHNRKPFTLFINFPIEPSRCTKAGDALERIAEAANARYVSTHWWTQMTTESGSDHERSAP
jgi:hypothetical protein